MNSTTTRMNTFLQRMIKKNDAKDEEILDGKMSRAESTHCQVEHSPRSYKSDWMKKLGGYSPSKRDISSSIGMSSPLRPITLKPTGLIHRYDYRRRSVPEPLTLISKNTVSKVEMPNLEKIIHEFEEGFLSPTKQETTKETIKTGRFVKQIVAAFEEKFKTYNGHKMEVTKSSNDLDKNEKLPHNIETNIENEMEERTAFMGMSYEIETALESQLSQYLDSCESKSETYSRGSVDSMDLDDCTFAMNDDLTINTPTIKCHDISLKSLKKSLNTKSLIINETLKPESPKILKHCAIVRSNSSMKRERQPKIVGAYLKKPIEVEDTSIDWIPITGKKLPRKRSFKRLLSVLTGKKSSEKSSKLYCSQVNLPEENIRELHDSGYDEKSCSSSSLASVVSFTDLLTQQDNYDVDTNRRTLTTFQQTNTINNDKNNAKTAQQSPSIYANQYDNKVFSEDTSDTYSIYSSKKLLLEEVPRSEVRLSLGPAFPIAAPRFIDKPLALDNKIPSTIKQDVTDYIFEEHSYDILPEISPLPKHPFVSSREKFDVDLSTFEPEKNINYFDKVELRRDIQSWKFPTLENTYDIPRKYKSKSDPGLATIDNKSCCQDMVYDVPKPEIPQRPRSSVYEDALSLKRRNEHITYSTPISSFYACPCVQEPHYATVKPRKTKVYPNRELIKPVGGISDYRIYSNYFNNSTF